MEIQAIDLLGSWTWEHAEEAWNMASRRWQRPEVLPFDCGLVPSSLGETEGLIVSSSKGGVGAGINLSHCLELQHVVSWEPRWREGSEEATLQDLLARWLDRSAIAPRLPWDKKPESPVWDLILRLDFWGRKLNNSQEGRGKRRERGKQKTHSRWIC